MADDPIQLTGPALADRINEAAQTAEADHDHMQVCLWFDGVAERGPYAGETPGVASATVTTHGSGGGVARGGDHIDYQIYLEDWQRWPRGRRVRKAWTLIDAALSWSANNLAAVDHE